MLRILGKNLGGNIYNLGGEKDVNNNKKEFQKLFLKIFDIFENINIKNFVCKINYN